MKIGDIVQVKRFDGGTHWLYAVVQSLPNGPNFFPARVQITHPGNAEDGKVVMAQPSDIRTKADVQAILDQMAPIVAKAGQHGIGEANIRQLAALDGFWSGFVSPADGRLTEHQSKHLSTQQTTVHKTVLAHYQNMMKQLS